MFDRNIEHLFQITFKIRTNSVTLRIATFQQWPYKKHWVNFCKEFDDAFARSIDIDHRYEIRFRVYELK